jgi:hypothetical protein
MGQGPTPYFPTWLASATTTPIRAFVAKTPYTKSPPKIPKQKKAALKTEQPFQIGYFNQC